MSKNPHPQAGKPPDYLVVGTMYECIPCLVLNRHRWAERAMKAEGALDKLKSELPLVPRLEILPGNPEAPK